MAPPKAPSLNLLRSLSTSSRAHANMAQITRNRCPPYPYGPALHYKQSNSGLYGGSSIQFGNKISEKNKIKSRRAWRPNIHNKRLWSDALGKFLSVKVQARVLRTIDKVGGLDEYLLGEKPQRIKELGVEGWRLRWKVMSTKAVRERFREERRLLGLPQDEHLERKAVARMVDQKVDGVEEVVDRISGKVVDQIDAADGAEPSIIEVEDTEDAMQGQPAEPVDHSSDTIEQRVERKAKEIRAREPQSRVAKSEGPSTSAYPGVVIRTSKPPGTRWGKAEKRAYRQQLEQGKKPGGEDDELDLTQKLVGSKTQPAEPGDTAKPLMDMGDPKGPKGGAFERLKGLLKR